MMPIWIGGKKNSDNAKRNEVGGLSRQHLMNNPPNSNQFEIIMESSKTNPCFCQLLLCMTNWDYLESIRMWELDRLETLIKCLEGQLSFYLITQLLNIP